MRTANGLVLVFLCAMLLTVPANGQALDREFLGLPWEADIREQKGYELLYEKGDLRYYIQPDTVREIKGFTISRVVYGTQNYRFFAAFLLIDSMETFDDIKAYMEKRYGFPKISWSVATTTMATVSTTKPTPKGSYCEWGAPRLPQAMSISVKTVAPTSPILEDASFPLLPMRRQGPFP